MSALRVREPLQRLAAERCETAVAGDVWCEAVLYGVPLFVRDQAFLCIPRPIREIGRSLSAAHQGRLYRPWLGCEVVPTVTRLQKSSETSCRHFELMHPVGQERVSGDVRCHICYIGVKAVSAMQSPNLQLLAQSSSCFGRSRCLDTDNLDQIHDSTNILGQSARKTRARR